MNGLNDLNTVNEARFAQQMRKHLNMGLHELNTDITTRLRKGREAALLAQKEERFDGFLAGVSGFFNMEDAFGVSRFTRQCLLASLIILSLAVMTFWAAEQRVQSVSEIDSALLTNNLPIAAFADKGFNAWLKASAAE